MKLRLLSSITAFLFVLSGLFVAGSLIPTLTSAGEPTLPDRLRARRSGFGSPVRAPGHAMGKQQLSKLSDRDRPHIVELSDP